MQFCSNIELFLVFPDPVGVCFLFFDRQSIPTVSVTSLTFKLLTPVPNLPNSIDSFGAGPRRGTPVNLNLDPKDGRAAEATAIAVTLASPRQIVTR